MMATRKTGLGRGLEALLGTGNRSPSPTQATQAEMAGDGLRQIRIDWLQPGKYQPRTGMDAARLSELAESIKAQGVIQPIVAREIGRNKFEIIAGERRWRAARQAGLDNVPVVLRDVDDRSVIAMALIENIQREDLNPLEEAVALSRLIDEFSLTHQSAAEAVGRSRAAVSNLLRLLELPEEIRGLLEARQLEMGHARALLTLAAPAAIGLAREAAAQGLSVREVERRAQQLAQCKIPHRKDAKPVKKADADLVVLERELSERLNAKVAVQHGRGGRGKLVIEYHGLDALEGILEKIRGRNE
ncbi:MAG: ParB/RepB/Spo0J family partition protein [Arenimonas sp.]